MWPGMARPKRAFAGSGICHADPAVVALIHTDHADGNGLCPPALGVQLKMGPGPASVCTGTEQASSKMT